MIKGIRNFLNGVAFGITETVPGVSGGTIAIILGFYHETIHNINHFTEDYRKSLRFFIPLALGIIVGLLSFASIMKYLLTNFSFPTMSFFIGLIVGIVPHIYSKARVSSRKIKPKTVALVILPILALIIMSIVLRSLKSESAADSAEVINNIGIPFMLFILLAGIIAAAALVIPGISGSFVLLLLGLYTIAIDSVSSIRLLLSDFTNTSLLLNICKVLIPLGVGIIIGGLSMARLVERLLKNHPEVTYSVILGLLLGSVYVLLTDPATFQSGVSALSIAVGLLTISAGSVISFRLGAKQF